MALDGNILDSFWVALGFKTDPKGIEQFEQASEKLRGFVLKLGAALSVPALGLFVEEVAKSVGHLKHFADVNHLSFEELQAFNAIARENSIDVESMDQGIANFNKRLGQAQIGTGRLLPILKKLGIGLKDARGHTKDVNAVMADLADKMHKFAAAGEGEKNLGLGQRLGLDPGMVLLLEKGSKAWREMFAEARKGAGLTTEEGDLARKTDDLFQQARHNIEILWDRIAFRLMPTVIRLLDKFNAWVKTLSPDKVNAFNRALETLEQVAESIGEDFAWLVETLQPFAEWIADNTPVWAMKVALYALAGALALVTFRLAAALSLGAKGAAALGAALGPISAIIAGIAVTFFWIRMNVEHLTESFAAYGHAIDWVFDKLSKMPAVMGLIDSYDKHFGGNTGNLIPQSAMGPSSFPAWHGGASAMWGASNSYSRASTVVHNTNVGDITVVSPDSVKAGEAVREALKPTNNRNSIRNAQSGKVL